MREGFDNNLIDIEDIISMSECTGLIPALPLNEDETDSYQDLYPIADQQLKKNPPN